MKILFAINCELRRCPLSKGTSEAEGFGKIKNQALNHFKYFRISSKVRVGYCKTSKFSNRKTVTPTEFK